MKDANRLEQANKPMFRVFFLANAKTANISIAITPSPRAWDQIKGIPKVFEITRKNWSSDPNFKMIDEVKIVARIATATMRLDSNLLIKVCCTLPFLFTKITTTCD